MTDSRGHGDGEREQVGCQCCAAERVLTDEHVAAVQAYLDTYGAKAFELAMTTGPLYADLRPQSTFAVHTAVRAAELGMDCALIHQVRPKAVKRGDRVNISVVMGESVQLVLDFKANDR